MVMNILPLTVTSGQKGNSTMAYIEDLIDGIISPEDYEELLEGIPAEELIAAYWTMENGEL